MSSIKELREICQPNTPTFNDFKTDKINLILNWYGYIIRKVSIYVTLLLVKTPISANQITFIGILFGIMGAMLLASTNFLYLLVGISMLFFSFFLDYVDGEVARYKKTTTNLGKVLDTISYDVPAAIMFFSLSLMAYESHRTLLGFNIYHNNLVTVAGFSASIFYLLIRLASSNFKLIFRRDENEKIMRHNSYTKPSNILSLFYILAVDRDYIIIFMPLLLFLNLLYLVPLIYGILYPFVWIAYVCYKWKQTRI